MTPEETKNCIEVMQGYVDGEKIQIAYLDRKDEESYSNPQYWGNTDKPSWNWRDSVYRIKPQQASIPATEDELERINRKTVWIKNKRNPDCMGHVLANDKIIDGNWLVFNPDTKCWEDWGEK